MDFLSLLDGGADYTQSSAVSARGQRSRITMREHAATGGHQSCAMPAHCLVGSDVLSVHALRFFDQGLFDLRHGLPAEKFEFVAHAADRPE